MVDAILSMSEYNRFSKGIFSWVGFKTKYLEYQNKERVAGKTSWNFWSLLKYSIDGIVSFSQTPLNIASYVGLFSSFASVIGIIFVIARKLIYGGSAFGWASMVCIFLFIGGIQLLCLVLPPMTAIFMALTCITTNQLVIMIAYTISWTAIGVMI